MAEDIAAIIEGASPDDLTLLRRALMYEELARQRGAQTDGDDALSENWRQGGYPYLNRLRRKSYEKQKYDLQRELLKLQRWVNMQSSFGRRRSLREILSAQVFTSLSFGFR